MKNNANANYLCGKQLVILGFSTCIIFFILLRFFAVRFEQKAVFGYLSK